MTVLTGLILYLTHKPTEPSQSADDGDSRKAADGDGNGSEVCCGLHAVCEKGLPSDAETVYFDDEELDRFAGREPDAYTSDEEEEFREVLYTLIPSDVYPWGVSLTRRGVAMPTALRDEWLMLAGDSVGNNPS